MVAPDGEKSGDELGPQSKGQRQRHASRQPSSRQIGVLRQIRRRQQRRVKVPPNRHLREREMNRLLDFRGKFRGK